MMDASINEARVTVGEGRRYGADREGRGKGETGRVLGKKKGAIIHIRKGVYVLNQSVFQYYRNICPMSA